MAANKKALGAVIALGMSAGAAQAGLSICNDTSELHSVSVGYKSGDNWVSEGWWQIGPGECAEPIQGDLQSRYYYYRAEVAGGEFAGDGYMFCTQNEAYTIVGDTECEARGFVRESFAVIDTGQTALTFVHRITAAPGAAPVQTPSPSSDREGREGVDVGGPEIAPVPQAPVQQPSQQPGQQPDQQPRQRPTQPPGQEVEIEPGQAPGPKERPQISTSEPAADPAPPPATGTATTLPGLLPLPTVSGTQQSGLAPGQHGAPFSARLVFQGCDYFEGLESCAFIGDGKRYIAEFDAPTPYEFLEPYLDVPPGKIMDVAGDITGLDGSSTKLAVTEITVVTEEDPYATLRTAMQGSWVPAEGGEETLTIRAAQMDSYLDGNYVDTYFIDIKPSCPDSAGAGPVMIQTSEQHGDSYCYLIDNLEGGWMDLILMGHEARVSYRKVE